MRESPAPVAASTGITADDDLALLAKLRARWPILAEPKPLKLGVRQDIRATFAGVSGVRISRAVLLHIATPSYQAALAAGGARYALDGSPAGEVTAKEARHAKAILEGKASVPTTKSNKKPKRPKASKASPPESTKPATTPLPQSQSAPPPPKPVEPAKPPATAVRPILRLKPKTGPVVDATVSRKEPK